MAGETRELKFKLALEYDAGGLGKFRSDVESVTSAARGASGNLDTLAGGIDSVATAAADLGASGSRAEASLADVARAGDETRESLADVAGATEEMTAAQARAAVTQAKLAQATRDVDAAQADLVSAVSRYGAESSQAEQATKGLVDAEKRLASASKDAEASLKAVGAVDLSGPEQDASSLGERLGGIGEQLSGLGQGSPISGLGDMFGDVGGKAGQAGQLVSGLSSSFSGLASGGSIVGGLSSGFTTLAASINPVTIGLAAVVAGAVAAGKALLDASRAALDMQQGVATATAKFGLLEDEAQALGDVGLEVWRNNWGSSIEETTVRAGQLRAVLGDMGSQDLSSLTQASFAFEQVFEKGQEDQSRMLQGFNRLGVEGEHALDLVTVAFQRTGDPADDLLDTFYEYGPQFERLGFSAEDMTQTLVSGLQAGAFNSDKVGDAVKEFGLRIGEGTDATRDALAMLDEDLATLPDRFRAGEVTGKEAFAIVQQAMQDFEGEIPGQVLADVFGGPGEDLTAGVIMQLDLAGENLGKVEGAAIDAGNAVNQNLGSAWEGLQRNLTGTLVPLVMPFVDAIRGPAIEALNLISQKITDFRESAAFDALVAGAKGLGTVLGGLLSLIVKVGGVLYDAFFQPGKLIGDIGVELGVLSDETADFIADISSPLGLVSTGFSAIGSALGLVSEEEDALAASADEAAVAQGRLGDASGKAASQLDPVAQIAADLQARLDSGAISTADAAAELLALAEAGEITEEQLSQLGSSLAVNIAPLSDTLASFGVGLDFDALADPQKLVDGINEANQAAHEAITGLYAEQLQAREQFATDEQALIDKGGQAVNDLLAKQAEERSDLATKQAREEADAGADPERLNKVREQNALELQDLAVKHERALQQQYDANANSVAALQEGFEQERQARIGALAQAALDQVNSMLQLGQVTEEQARVIFGSLQQAAPDSALFDPAAEAALNFSATLGQALGGDVAAAVSLGDELKNVDAALDESVAHADQYASGSVAAYEAARVAVESSAAGATTAADIEAEANQRRIDSHLEVDATIVESGNVRAGVRTLDAQSSTALADTEIADNARRNSSCAEAAGITESEFGRMSSARTSAAGVSRTASDQMVGDTQRIASEAQGTAGVVDQSVGGIGRTYTTSAAGVKVGTDAIVSETGRANQALSGLGSGVPSSLAPATDSVLKLRGGVQLLAEDVDAAAQVQISAQDDAARAATGASDDTVEGFSAVQQQGVDTREEIVALREAMEQLPKRIDIPLTVPGAEQVQAIFAAIEADIEALQTAATIRIYGEYIPKDPAMEQGGSIRLQHDIEDAISAAGPGVYLAGTYDGTGGALWTGDGLAITDALAELQELSRLGLGDDFARLLFDPDPEAATEIARLAQAIRDADAALRQAEAAADIFEPGQEGALRLAEAIGRITGAMNAWFTENEQATGSLASTLALMVQTGQQVDAMGRLIESGGLGIDQATFLNSLGFDASSFAELHAQIAALDGEPERQREMWKAVVDALIEDWGRFYDDQKANLDAQKKRLEEQRQGLGPDADTTALDAQIEAIEAALAALDERNRSIADGLSLQGDGLDRMMEAYGRISDEQERLVRAEEEANRERERAIKLLEDNIKARQKAALDAERDAHDQAMDLLDEEQKARERAHRERMAFLDSQREAEEQAIKRRMAEEEEAHKRNLAAITAQVDAQDALLAQRKDDIDKAKELIELVETGGTLTAEQAAFLRSMQIDPDQLLKANAGLAQTRTEIERLTKRIEVLSRLFDSLPDELGRVRIAGSQIVTEAGKQLGEQGAAFGEAERARLEEMLASGGLSKSDRRIIEVFLAGGRVQSQRLREILGPALGTDETALGNAQQQVDLAKQQADLAGQVLAAKQAQLAIDERANKKAREALQSQIDSENSRYEDWKAHANDRLNAIDAERRRVKEAYDAEREAIADAKEAEEDRHRERLRQIDEEYALQLLRAGRSEAEVQDILNQQRERAAAIAVEAERRFNEMLAAARVATAPIVVAIQPSPGGRQAKQPGLTPPPPAPPPAPPPPPPPTPFGIVPGEPLPIGDMFGGIEAAAAVAGRGMATALVDPALDRMDDLYARALDISGLFASRPDVAAFMGGGTAHIDNGIHFHGDVYIDRDVAEEIGLYDAARMGAP